MYVFFFRLFLEHKGAQRKRANDLHSSSSSFSFSFPVPKLQKNRTAAGSAVLIVEFWTNDENLVCVFHTCISFDSRIPRPRLPIRLERDACQWLIGQGKQQISTRPPPLPPRCLFSRYGRLWGVGFFFVDGPQYNQPKRFIIYSDKLWAEI